MEKLRLVIKWLPRVLAVLLILAAPNLLWRLSPAKTLDVVIVDKTVPFKKFREHAAIPWLLHTLKFQGEGGNYLDPARDYVGFDPDKKTGEKLTAALVAKADVLVVADTYGVYVGDYERPNDEAALERSPKIYGGLDDGEAQVIEDFVKRGGLAVAEFNTFASPTEDAPRARLEKLFGVRWTKWVARYWPNLQDPNEVPKWVGRVWERVTHTPFDMTGAGLVFVREDQDILVLREGEDLGSEVVSQLRTPRGAAFDLPERGGFWFWMDVVEPIEGAEVLYEHVIGATPQGERKLWEHKLPVRFPAVVKRGDAWYLAGDFVDTAIELGNPERAGLLGWRQRTLGCGGGSSADGTFFWSFYAPLMARLFTSRAH